MAYREAIASVGLPVTFDYEKYIRECWGPTYREFLPIMGVPAERQEEIHDLKKNFYEPNLKYATENTHLFNIITAMRNEYHTAVVTSGSRNAKDILKHFNREDLFDIIFTIDDVKKGKPDPEGFFKAMEYFGVEGKDTIIFEDSKVGLEAARKTGASICLVDDFK